MPVESPFPDVTVPDRSLPSFVFETAGEYGDEPAVVDAATGRTLTFEGLSARVDGVAAGLADRGFEPGDVFAIYAPNRPAYPVAFHGATAAGGAVTTIDPRHTAEEATRQLSDTDARFLLADRSVLGKATEAAAKTRIEEAFVLETGDDTGEGAGPNGGEGPDGSDGSGPAFEPFSTLVETGASPPDVAVEPTDLAALPYSSGTTGRPKGVELTHRTLVANVAQLGGVEPPEITHEDVAIGVLPFSHIYGMTVVMNFHLRAGATVVTLPEFDLEPFLETMEAYGVTAAFLAPPIVRALAGHPAVEDYDLSELEVVTSGAAPLAETAAEGCAERIGCLVKEGYGLTEASPVTHITPRDSDMARRGSVGPPLPNTECRVVDVDTGEELDAGEEGEVLVRGPQVMRGYLDRPEATEAAFEDGWLRTGDLGVVDEDGYLAIRDRLTDLIKHKGTQVSPAELEDVLLAQPSVADAAVVGKPDEAAGEVPVAFVVPDGDLDPEAIRESVAERVASYKELRAVRTVEEIPKSASGTILRRVLLEEHVED